MRRTFSISVGVIVMAVAIGFTSILIATKKTPAKSSGNTAERTIAVEVITPEPENLRAPLVGFGEVKSLREAHIASEISGTVNHVAPELLTGTRVREGDVLLRLDPAQYDARLRETEAELQGLVASRKELENEFAKAKTRLSVLRKTEDLATDEVARRERMVKEAIGNQRDADTAERELNQTRDTVLQLEEGIEAFPTRSEMLVHSIASAEARRNAARIQLERCTIRAPFDGRITYENISLGDYVSEGQNIINLADDRVLEIPIPLPGEEAMEWLPFDSEGTSDTLAGFPDLEPVTCRIQWTGGSQDREWSGRLHRVENFDAKSRTVTAVIRVELSGKSSASNGSPLISGMFCEVQIPSRPMENVIGLPRWAVGLDGQVYVADNEMRLRTAQAKVVRTVGDTAYIRVELSPGEQLITTRLLSPIERSLLIIQQDRGALPDDRDRMTYVAGGEL